MHRVLYKLKLVFVQCLWWNTMPTLGYPHKRTHTHTRMHTDMHKNTYLAVFISWC